MTLDNKYDLCQGKSINVVAESNGTSFEWKKGNVIIPNQNSKSLNIVDAGTYTIIALKETCQREFTFTVTSRPSPTFDLGSNETLCPNKTKTLSPGVFTSYLWSNGATTATLIVNAGMPVMLTNTTYVVTITNEFGCTNKDSVTITLTPKVKATLMADKPGICNGEPVTLTAGGGLIYIWTDPSNTLSTTTGNITIASPTITTTYDVEVVDGLCPDNKESKSIKIEVFEASDVSAGKDSCVILGRTIKLNAKGGVKYDWDNKDLIVGASNISNPVVKPVEETVFTVTITDKNGCEYVDDIKICINEDPLSLFKAVSIITPNGDGSNDELYFAGLESFPKNSLKIFNRWGGLIFEAKGYQSYGTLFNGMRNGNRLPADTYYYVLIFEDQVVKSSLTILWD
ncbi:MAG: gliding motility-associated C-terminal domain-containing protein [Saprospiraceae bacterium]|nr:gliding motility-associated C-terminal domain-containing protein [Saprospiraceae bacterium]